MMGRPRLYEERRIATAVRLPVSLHDKLKRAAMSREVSVNFLLTRAVTAYLQRLEAAGQGTDEVLILPDQETGSSLVRELSKTSSRSGHHDGGVG